MPFWLAIRPPSQEILYAGYYTPGQKPITGKPLSLVVVLLNCHAIRLYSICFIPIDLCCSQLLSASFCNRKQRSMITVLSVSNCVSSAVDESSNSAFSIQGSGNIMEEELKECKNWQRGGAYQLTAAMVTWVRFTQDQGCQNFIMVQGIVLGERLLAVDS